MKGPKLGAHILKMAKVIEGASVETVTKSADRAAKLQEARIKRDSGGDSKLSGVNASKGRGGNAAVGVKVTVNKSKTSPSALVAATGPLQIINNNTAGHVIRSAYLSGGGLRSGTSKKFGQLSQAAGPGLSFGRGNFIGPRKAEVINIPGVGFRRSARHPGTKGKQTWQLGRKTAEPVIRKEMSGRTFNVVKGAAKL
jgi:hypothetical protein